jgi:aryl-alcohol dehydrogenase-like predicted oxidoreductase
LKKVESLDFLLRDGERTLGQAALQFVLSEPTIVSTLPNIYNQQQLAEFAAATATPEMSDAELAKLADLYRKDFNPKLAHV